MTQLRRDFIAHLQLQGFSTHTIRKGEEALVRASQGAVRHRSEGMQKCGNGIMHRGDFIEPALRTDVRIT